MSRLTHTDDVERAAWISPRLHGDWSTIASLVPDGFESYALASLAAATGGEAPITAALWTGYGTINGQGTSSVYTSDGSTIAHHEPDPGWVTSFETDVIVAPQVHLPGRDYALFTGRLGTLVDPQWRKRSGWAWQWRETVNLLWPDDRSWFVLSEIDFDSTVIGCSAAHAERILASPLEAVLIPGDCSLGHDADRVNA